MITHRFLALASAGILLATPAHAAKLKDIPNPDFTKGEKIPDGATKDWNLGATGARGWIHTHNFSTEKARQIFLTKVATGSPADSVLQKGDVILGIGSIAFD